MTQFKKYRRKPVVVEAVQWPSMNGNTGSYADSAKPIVDLIKSLGGDAGFVYDHDESLTYHPRIAIKTLEGVMHASPNDYICRGLVGEFWPVKPHVFEKTNEPIVETEEPVNTALITLKEHD